MAPILLVKDWKPCDIQQNRTSMASEFIRSQNHVYNTQPSTIVDLKSIVNDFARNMDSQMISKASKSASARFVRFYVKTLINVHVQQ